MPNSLKVSIIFTFAVPIQKLVIVDSPSLLHFIIACVCVAFTACPFSVGLATKRFPCVGTPLCSCFICFIFASARMGFSLMSLYHEDMIERIQVSLLQDLSFCFSQGKPS